MSFFWPNSATNVLSAVDSGMVYDDAGGFTTQFDDAATMLQDNFSALEDYTAARATTVVQAELDGAGAATVPHLIGQPFGLLVAQAWCKGATASDFGPVTVTAVDATNVTLAGGTALAPVRVFVMYSIVPPGW